ncbi:MAG TPA: carboxypeptidase-like regulatory domain-containing protein, partial [Pyrinomonadaceae bacterium]|nr:carboxypeptidase-like regulatory domain-containing protein [Pyrinomonadaceae bacterium]
MKRIVRACALSSLIVVVMAGFSPALAQITTTGIRGLVRDPNGAVVPNATVKVTDTSTGVEQTT